MGSPRKSAHVRIALGMLLIGGAALLAAAAATLFAPAALAAPKPFVICNDYGGQAGPDMAGSVIVWTDNRNGNLDIYGRNLSTGKTFAVCANKAQQSNPSVTRRVTESGKVTFIAVWVDKRNHSGGDATDIYARDITAGRTFVVEKSATVKWFPRIVDDWVVWIEADDPPGPYRIMARDLDAGATHEVGTSKILSSLAIDRRTVGSRTVYTVVWASGKGNISGRNVPDGEPFVISARSTFEWMPDISGNRVVWWESGGRVMLRNIKTGKRTFVHNGSRPRIDGELVTWDGGGYGGQYVISYKKDAKVYVRNVARSKKVTAIGQKNRTCLFPVLSGKRVVWESGPASRVLTHIHLYGARVP